MKTADVLYSESAAGRLQPVPARPSRLKEAVKNFFIVSLPTVAACILVVEIPLRIAGYGRLEIYEPDPLLFWRLKPNQEGLTKVDRKPFHINSHGTRGQEFETVKPARTIRILSLGDSITFGWGLSDEETYSALLETGLQRRIGRRSRVEVINAGVNAWSYPQMHAYFRDRGLHYAPDYVVVGQANLWTQFTESVDPDFVRKFFWSVRLKNFLRRFAIYHYLIEVKLESVYQRYRQKFIPVDSENHPLAGERERKQPRDIFREAIEQLCRLALTRGVTPVLVYIPDQQEVRDDRRSAIYEIKRDVARELAVPFVDLAPFLKAQRQELYLDADPVHLNTAGNRLIAQELVGTLERLIEASHPDTGLRTPSFHPTPTPAPKGGRRAPNLS